MDTRPLPQTNFACLKSHDEQLMRLGMLAEKYFTDDPNTSLLKQRQYAEWMAQLVASKVGAYKAFDENQFELLRRLQNDGVLQRDVAELFHQIRKTGNDANHEIKGNHALALSTLKLCWQLAVWFHRAFKDRAYKSGPFIPPAPPKDESADLRAELERMAIALADHKTTQQQTTDQLQAASTQLKAITDEKAFWEQMAHEADQARTIMQAQLAAAQAQAAAQTKGALAQLMDSANAAAKDIDLDEADTRLLIDAQLRQWGWEADSKTLTYGKGARPQKGCNRAIAEWPTGSGPADYMLFAGMMPIAVVEAKRKHVDVSASLQQAQRYSRDFIIDLVPDLQMEQTGRAWQDYKVPFAFATNGRPYLRQLSTRSGIWFRDLRRAQNLARPLDDWRTPEGLLALLAQNETAADAQLVVEPFHYDFGLRDYQQRAIRAVEQAIMQGKREMLLAMATGTGKTKTCIALIYRLLKVKRFRRVLFLVDRSALGEQAANAFKDTRMESLQTFADIFGIKEMEDQTPDSDTAVHVATVQGMVQRVLGAGGDEDAPAVDQYDCIIVDECHRGYLLDREMSDTELSFRSLEDYISKYRRVLDYFDAVKIGLTATPALHTTEIFGQPVFSYTYREAVIDGYLVDHEPPYQIETQLSRSGIQWHKGEAVKVYDAQRNTIDLFKAPDEIKIDLDEFNRKVITPAFNRVVCEALADEIDPQSPHKTLIFCVNDAHADLVVMELLQALQARYGEVENDAVLKITGNADKPLQLIRRFKNERNPNVAVTVDLLTTGIDVPEICNLVFLRRVNSRILFEQMLGRATRPCDAIGKETFRIFDAVKMYEAIQTLTTMQPVVSDPKVSFVQLAGELARAQNDAQRELARDQFVAKLQRKKHLLGEYNQRDFETRAGMTPDAFARRLRQMPLDQIAEWFVHNPGLGEILDRKSDGPRRPMLVSEHEDALHSIERGYGNADKPADYLHAFAAFIHEQGDAIPALALVLTRPRELTRRQLRELALALDEHGYSVAGLTTAWREMTNQEIAAGVMGFVRQAAMNETLLPFDQRVDQALAKLMRMRYWTKPQQEWLKKIAAQTKANMIVDRDALDDPNQIFKREGGGFVRLNKMFDGQLLPVLAQFNDALWTDNP